METQIQVKSKLKRQRENVVFTPRKSQRLAAQNDPVFTTKIVDLNDDCLVKVFGHLDLRSLFNISISNEWLRPAAREVYKRKFGETRVQLNVLKPFKVSRKGYVLGKELTGMYTYCVTIGLKACLQYLRCFGPWISDLEIDYDVSKNKYHKIVHRYVNDYCGENLQRISFGDMLNIAIDEFQKVFTNVKEVEISGGNFGQQWPTLVKCFPNVRSLNIEFVVIDNRLIGESFEFLEHLDVHDLKCSEFEMNQIVGDLMNGIHRLKNLRITMAKDYLCIDELLTMIKDSPSITNFEYCLGELRFIPVKSTEVQRILAECPALIELKLKDYRFTTDDAFALIRQLKSLKHFEFHTEELEELESQLVGSEWEVIIDDSRGFYGNHAIVTLDRQTGAK